MAVVHIGHYYMQPQPQTRDPEPVGNFEPGCVVGSTTACFEIATEQREPLRDRGEE